TAMAHELEIAAAIVAADLGDVASSVAELDTIVEQATAGGSVLTATWAAAGRSCIVARTDPAAALAAAGAGTVQAREIDFPIAVTMRTVAFAHLLLDDLAAAGAAVGELIDDLVERGALSNLRIVVDVAAALAHRSAHPMWERLVATARALPITTVAAAHFELIPLPEVSAAPLARQQVIAAIRQVIADEPADRAAPTAAPSIPSPEARAAVIRQLGDMWELEFHGRTVAVRSSKGLVDIV